jgi:hypothetical protein
VRHRGVAVYNCTMRPTLGAALLFLAACAHTDLGRVEPPENPPHGGGIYPVQLTLNQYDDRQPQWLPDGSGIIYSTERGDQQYDRDRCIALLPPDGGTQRWRQCQTDGRYVDTTDVWEWPSVGPDGRTVFIKTTGWINAKKVGFPTIALASGKNFAGSHQVRSLPFVTPSGVMEGIGWTFRWLDDHRIVYLGVYQFFQGSTFLPDTFYTGQEVMLIDIADPAAPTFTVVPGTQWASSVAVGDDSTSIYYTIGGDSLVYRRHLTSGVVDTVHNFGWNRVARDVSVRGNTLAAIVGDSVIFSFEAPHQQWVQRDEGGGLSVVDLTDGSEVYYTLSPLWQFRHPELSPDGSRLVVERQPFAYPILQPISSYNATNHRADLWLFAVGEAPLAP